MNLKITGKIFKIGNLNSYQVNKICSQKAKNMTFIITAIATIVYVIQSTLFSYIKRIPAHKNDTLAAISLYSNALKNFS